MKTILLTSVLFALTYSVPVSYGATAVCPTTIENNPSVTADGCGILLTITSLTTVVPIATGTDSYNGSDSTFGVVNNTSRAITSLLLINGTAPITQFSGNGITRYISANGVPIPPTPQGQAGFEDYYGPVTSFRSVDYNTPSFYVDFTGTLQPGASTYFSLAGDPASDVAGFTAAGGFIQVFAAQAVPEPSSLLLIVIPLIILKLSKLPSRSLQKGI